MTAANQMPSEMLDEERAARLQETALLWIFGAIDFIEYTARDACTILGIRWDQLSPDEWTETKEVIKMQLGPYAAEVKDLPVQGKPVFEAIADVFERYDALVKPEDKIEGD